MENKHKELLSLHRTKFTSAIEVDKILPILQRGDVLNSKDVDEINNQSGREARADKLLDILPSKSNQAFMHLCQALETSYPHLLTVMFLGTNQRASTPDSRSLSLTSDSEDDLLSPTSQLDSRSQELDGNKTYTRIIPSHEYDLHDNNYAGLANQQDLHKKTKSQLDRHQRATMNSSDRHRDYDRLKTQCEQAMGELQALKHQQDEMEKRYEMALKDGEAYSQNYKTALGALQQSKEEKVTLKSQIHELLADKKRLEQEIGSLQKLREEDKLEMADLRQQQREVINESGSSEVLNKMYDSALDKYEAVKNEYDTFRERYSDLMSRHSEATGKLEILREDNIRLRKQYESVCMERDASLSERNGLKQQCTAAIRNWDQVIHERDQLKEELSKVTMKRDEMIKGSNVIITEQIRKFEMVCKERDAAKKEYNLVWAERASVHKEIDQLQDKVNEYSHTLENLEKEKKSTCSEMESLKHELVTALQDRDKAIKERKDWCQKYGDILSKHEQLESQHDDFQKDLQMVTQERDIARKERHEAIKDRDTILRETYERERCQKEKAEEMDQVSKETETLKRSVEKLHRDLQDALNEVDSSKKSRDWALHERDKIVQERDSIRTLCDSLRQQRDRAVSDKAKTLRDYDELKKQKTEAYRELKETKEKYESVIEKEARKNQLNGIGHNHSRDSAIDADLQEWETEEIQVQIGRLNPDNLGFDIVGGKDDTQLPNDNSIYVSHISKGSSVDGKLRVNDVLLKVNNLDTTNMLKRSLIQVLRDSADNLSVLVRRRRCITPRVWQPLQLNLTLGKDTGIYIESGLYVSRINPGSTVAKEGLLITGDRIVAVNGHSVESLTAKELMNMLDHCGESVFLEVWRQTSPLQLSSAGSSPTPVTQNSLSHLQDQMSSSMTKSESPSLKGQLWDGNITSDSGKSSTKMRSSGSQTDSLDSPGPTPRHKDKRFSENHRDVGKSHHSVMDKAIDKIKNFRHRHKSQERHDTDDNTLTKQDVNMLSSVRNTPDVLGEFDLPMCNQPDKQINNKKNSSSRKRELEAENSGTWPKCYRLYPATVNGTVVQPSPQRRYDRPKLEGVFNPSGTKNPPTPPERTGASFDAVRHSPQSSDSTITGKYRHSPQSSDSTLQYGSPSPLSSPNSSSKSAQYLTNSIAVPFPSDCLFRNSDQPYVTHRSAGVGARNVRNQPKRNTVSSVPGDFMLANKEGYEAHPPPRVRHKPNRRPERDNRHKHHHNSHGSNYKPSHMYSSHDSTNYKTPHPAVDMHHGPLSSSRWSNNMSQPFDGLNSPPSSSGGDGHRMYASLGPGQAHRPQQSTSANFQMSRPMSAYSSNSHTSRTGQQSLPTYSVSPSYSSPSGSVGDWDSDIHRYSPSSYNDLCSSPSPSQMSSTTSDHMGYSYMHNRNSPVKVDSYDTNTFPRKPRIHYPLPVSTDGSTKSGSVEVVSARSSPGSPMLDSSIVTSHSVLRRKPQRGETRTINIERMSQPVGFNIERGHSGGIFVSVVHSNSLAAQAGLVIGDQLLEICGINMRTAKHEIAATVLRQCGNTLSLLVQYNPDEYKVSDSSGDSSNNNSPTNSPDSSTFKKKNNPSQSSMSLEAPRYVTLKKSSPSTSLGISIIGGNAVGIFIREVQASSIAFGHDGLHCGDQILQYNGMDFTSVTKETAANELLKPCLSVYMRVQYNLEKYNKIQDKPGDLFYVRSHFDRTAEAEGEVSFYKDSILMVEDTMYDGVPGNWYAWLLDDDCRKRKSGTIPSKGRLEDEVLRRSHSGSLSLQDLDEVKGSSRRGSGSARRSFIFRRKHKRNNSKDSREFSSSFSEGPLNSESVPILDDVSLVAYTHVNRMECKKTRPVVLLAPLAQPLISKMVSSSPDKYMDCQKTIKQKSCEAMEQGLQDGSYIDYWVQDDHYLCIHVSTIKDICDRGIHCLLSISPAAIERFHRLQIYPIVIFARHKSFKQIREIRDPQFHTDKLSNKAARDVYDKFQKIEQDYRHLFSAVIQGGNLAEMVQQLKTVITSEQSKAIWVPASR